MSGPRGVKPSRAAGHLKKMAKGLAALYDDVENGSLQSPISTHGPLDVMVPRKTMSRSNVIDLTTPEPASSRSAVASPPAQDSEDSDNVMNIDEAPGKSHLLEKESNILTEWIGTSQFFIEDNVDWQENGQMDNIILYLRAIKSSLAQSPYDPSVHIDLSKIVSKIGFTDIGIAHAYRAILLIEGFKIRDPELHPHVRDVLAIRLMTQSDVIVEDELDSYYLHAYRELLSSMLGCGCFWDGVLVTKKALKLFPRDPELLEIRQWLLDGFKDRCDGLKQIGADPQDSVVRSRVGKLYQKLYPWMDKELFKRKPALVRAVNKKFGAGNCEVRLAVFGPPPSRSIQLKQISQRRKEQEDVGPLGIFATKDIKEGNTVLVDQCVSVISDVPSSRLEHCDACHATLKIPFHHPAETIKATCCKAAAFCSRKCAETAIKGYHSILCGKDFDWLYENPQSLSAGPGYRWPSIMFLRLIAIILLDRKVEERAGQKPTHPLQHPLLARMTANYSHPSKLHPDELNDWDYKGSIVAPTRILCLLGINIFTDHDFSQDVIQTILWRIQNNASMSVCDLFSPKPEPSSSSTATLRSFTGPDKKSKSAIQMICLNPSYLFFNHSCDPNISWHGAIPDPWVDLSWITGYNGEIVKVGSSAVFCRAGKDIKEGEELKISYIGDPQGDREAKRSALKKWFEGGCGCELCIKENEEMMKKGENRSSSRGESWISEKLEERL